MSTCHVNASIVDQSIQKSSGRVLASGQKSAGRFHYPTRAASVGPRSARGSETLFVGKRVYRIQVSGSCRRIKSAQRTAKQANCRSSQCPPATEFKNES